MDFHTSLDELIDKIEYFNLTEFHYHYIKILIVLNNIK